MILFPNYSRGTLKGKKHYWAEKIRKGEIEMPPRPENFEPEELTPEQQAKDETVKSLLEYLQNKGVPITPEDSKLVRGIKLWEMGYKDKDGEGGSMLLHSVELSPDIDGLKQEIIRKAPPVIIKPAKYVRTKSRDKSAIIIPDLQGGYRRYGNELEPVHDENVVEVGLQIIRDVSPDLVVLNGDNLDFPELSSFNPDSTHFQQTMQATIDRVYEILATVRASAPDSRIIWLEGNHEHRLSKRILKHNAALWGVKRPNEQDDFSWLSVPHLMNLEEIGVEYISGYPANSFRINDRLQAIHGDKLRSTSSTAALYTKEEDLSTVFGHVHRIERHSRTSRRLGKIITAASFGTWARIDGAVPSYGNGIDDYGKPVQRFEDWQNGMGFVEYREGDSPFQMTEIPIDHNSDYVTIFNGKTFRPDGKRV